MAEIIEFYRPEGHKEQKKWVSPEDRGKEVEFGSAKEKLLERAKRNEAAWSTMPMDSPGWRIKNQICALWTDLAEASEEHKDKLGTALEAEIERAFTIPKVDLKNLKECEKRLRELLVEIKAIAS
jgi:hypothetical protein